MARVLVVDDEFGILRLIEDVLFDEGHTVVVAINGRQALDRIAETPPDIVLTDFMMPIMDGAELIDAITAMPELAHVPVIMMTSLSEASLAERCLDYAAFVRKPFQIFDLIDLVARFAEGRDKT